MKPPALKVDPASANPDLYTVVMSAVDGHLEDPSKEYILWAM